MKEEPIKEAAHKAFAKYFKIIGILQGFSLLIILSSIVVIWFDGLLAVKVFFTGTGLVILFYLMYTVWENVVIKVIKERLKKLNTDEYTDE